ncbi:hypothetical protein DKG77_09810 [Flagellimonas aquimarina]|uniref:Antibiotic biosynthesis monooxygenase n=1 Tax=Flagellimonas aquimarina TaxID=2201895 RepID=A0A316KZQ7_9FLAO|nr:hypothetical protein [Allomuricauda koreensis]PWL38548.1 hypothetical protein DKG77_09810 [Allomuricauda koreensis]
MNRNRPLLEWAPFTIKKGITEDDLMKASEALQKDFLQNQKGFVKRDLLEKFDRNYIDLVYWETIEDAKNALENAEKNPACLAYFKLMEEVDQSQPEQGVSHFEILRSY